MRLNRKEVLSWLAKVKEKAEKAKAKVKEDVNNVELYYSKRKSSPL